MPEPAKRDRSIRTYRAKRDFAATPEPKPAARKKRRKGPIFVVQKHDARHLHYDFRLEHEGVLLSWAVPKGPSMDPADKRLAVHVEDHPVDYADFSGVIPEGNYGAGTVEIWDHGSWAPASDVDAALARGELKFSLRGERLRGAFVLVRLKPRGKERGENWLLIKEQDAAEPPGRVVRAVKAARRKAGWKAPADAVQAEKPASQAPMLASAADAPPEGGEWLIEIKFDGYRLMVFKDAGRVRLLTRNGLDWTDRLPQLARKVAALPAETLLADGELVALRADGVSSFADLQAALSGGHDDGLALYLFDLLYRDGWDLRQCGLTDRKAALAELLAGTQDIQFSDHIEGQTQGVRAKACAMGLEGIICKRADAPYRAGRGRSWLKIKCQGREEFVVVGWTRPQGSRTGLGALHLGYYDAAGNLHYAGGCGSGFSDRTLADLTQRLAALAADPPGRMQLTEEPPPHGIVWVKPTLVVEVQFTAWSGAGRLRHAVFLGLREDKAAAEIVRDVADEDAERHTLGRAAPKATRIVTARKPGAKASEIDGVRLTHPERALWPGITKQDLAQYWQSMAKTALPGIAARPLALVRCPDGIDGEHFFQKHANRGMPDPIREGVQDGAPFLAFDDAAGLMACAQMSAIEIHSWGSALKDAAHPDRLVIDLDPGEGVAWADIVRAAHDVRDRLGAENLESFPRTSGGKGLHLVVPLVPRADWPAARAWCRGFAEGLAKERPDLYVAATAKAIRRGRILIDWLRNGLGATAVASYSPRARPHATVATPLTWKEVTARLDPQGFTLATVPDRVGRLKRDPWQDFDKAKRPLPKENPHG